MFSVLNSVLNSCLLQCVCTLSLTSASSLFLLSSSNHLHKDSRDNESSFISFDEQIVQGSGTIVLPCPCPSNPENVISLSTQQTDKDMEVINRRFPRPYLSDYFLQPQLLVIGIGPILAIRYVPFHIIEICFNLRM